MIWFIALMGLLCGFSLGFAFGCADTERRWSDAVKRTEPPSHVKGCVSKACHAKGRECPACV